jgi:hypothetical protein
MITETSRGKSLWARSKARLLRSSDGGFDRQASEALAWIMTRYSGQEKNGASGCRVLIAGSDKTARPQSSALLLARAVAQDVGRVLLIDTSQGATALSGPLELPRAPGFSELCQGKAGFSEVIRRDPEGTLHFLATGKPRVLAGEWGAPGMLDKVCRALDESYNVTLFCAELPEAMLLARTLRRPFVAGVMVRSRDAETDASDDLDALDFPLHWLDQRD